MEALISGWLGPDLVVSSQSFRQRLKKVEDAGLSTVTVRLNTPGGSVFEASAIYAQLENFRKDDKKANMEIDGMAASAGSLVMLASDSIAIAETGMVFIHDSRATLAGSARQIGKDMQILQKIDKTVVGLYARKSGKKESEMAVFMKAETWFTASEAVDVGLVDKVNVHTEKEGGDAVLFTTDPTQTAYDKELEAIINLA